MLALGISSPLRIAKTLGLPEDDLGRMSVHENWYKRSKDIHPIPPRLVSFGPVQENVLTGEEIDVLKFPLALSCYPPNYKVRYFKSTEPKILDIINDSSIIYPYCSVYHRCSIIYSSFLEDPLPVSE